MGSLIERKKRIMMISKKSRLPSSYQEVEYIYYPTGAISQGAWIDTGIVPNTYTVSKIKFMNLSATGDVIYGYYVDSDSKDYRLFNANQVMYFDCIGTRLSKGGVSLYQNDIYELEIGNNYVKDIPSDLTVLNGTYSPFTGYHTITLNSYANATRIAKNRWYYVKIFDGSTIVRDMVPCIRLSDITVGMYDLVSNSFFSSLSQEGFYAGNPV